MDNSDIWKKYFSPKKIEFHCPHFSNDIFPISVLNHGTRIHTNQDESRAYTRLMSPLIAVSRGTLMPSQSARAFWAYFYRPSRLRGRKHPCAGSAISRKRRRRRGCDSCWLVWIRVPNIWLALCLKYTKIRYLRDIYHTLKTYIPSKIGVEKPAKLLTKYTYLP